MFLLDLCRKSTTLPPLIQILPHFFARLPHLLPSATRLSPPRMHYALYIMHSHKHAKHHPKNVNKNRSPLAYLKKKIYLCDILLQNGRANKQSERKCVKIVSTMCKNRVFA